jgi:HK97 family phage portal protein
MVNLKQAVTRAREWLAGSGAPVEHAVSDGPTGLKTIHGTPIQTTGAAPWTSAGAPVNTMPGVFGISPAANLAMSSAAVWACCRLISTSIAALPTDLFKITPEGKVRADNHPLYAMLTQTPNPSMPLQQWIQPTLLGLLLYGNSYTWVDRVGDEVVGIWPLNPARVHLVLMLDGTFRYYYSDFRGKFNVFREEEIIHFRLFTMDGYFGLPVLIYHQMTIGLQAASTTYAYALYNNGGQPGGALEYPGVLKKDQVDRIRDSWTNIHSGPANAGRLAILEEGMKYTPIGIPPEQLQYIQEQKFSVEQIARIFGVPPHLIGAMDKPTYASVEQQSIEFVRYTLYPYVRVLEQAVDKALLDPTKYAYKFNLNAFERGDISTRYNSYATGRQWGWLSVNDVRTMEDMNTIEGGDDYLTPLNMISVPVGQQPPPPAPPKPPAGGTPNGKLSGAEPQPKPAD